MKLRQLTETEIEELANRAGVRKTPCENFLMSMGNNSELVYKNLIHDAKLYGWNKQTVTAIADGILIAGTNPKVQK